MEDDGEGAGDRAGGVLRGAPTELAVTPSGGPGWVLDRFLLPQLLLLVTEGTRRPLPPGGDGGCLAPSR